MPLPQHEPQSAGHDEQISPPLHVPSPHWMPPVDVLVLVDVVGPLPSPPIDDVMPAPSPLPPLLGVPAPSLVPLPP